jgi:hypothetical protein
VLPPYTGGSFVDAKAFVDRHDGNVFLRLPTYQQRWDVDDLPLTRGKVVKERTKRVELDGSHQAYRFVWYTYELHAPSGVVVAQWEDWAVRENVETTPEVMEEIEGRWARDARREAEDTARIAQQRAACEAARSLVLDLLAKGDWPVFKETFKLTKRQIGKISSPIVKKSLEATKKALEAYQPDCTYQMRNIDLVALRHFIAEHKHEA